MIAIYARQSVDVHDSISIETQIAICRARLAAQQEVHIYMDRGYSGATEQRPGWQDCLQAVRAGEIEQICVYKLDRLIRSMTHFSRMMEEFYALHVSVCCELGVLNPDDPACALQTNILMSFAQFERETIRTRVRDNYYARAQRGMYLGGTPPYGFEKHTEMHRDGRRIVLHAEPHASRVVQQLFAHCAQGESLGALANALHACGEQTSRGKPFTSAGLSRILRSPVYVRADAHVYAFLYAHGAQLTDSPGEYDGTHGVWVYGDPAQRTGMKFTNLSHCTASLALHEGFVDAARWLECQHRLEKNRALKRTGKGARTWLSGVLYCSVCGRACSPVGEYFTCGGKKLGLCARKSAAVRIRETEDAVKKKLFTQIEYIEKNAKLRENCRENEKNKQFIQMQLKTAQNQLKTLLDAASLEKLSAPCVRQSVQALDERCRELEQKLDSCARPQKPCSSILPLRDGFERLELADKKRVVRCFFRRIELRECGLDFFCV